MTSYVGYRTVFEVRQEYFTFWSTSHATRMTNYLQESVMTKQTKDQHQKPGQAHPSPLEEVNKQKQKTEEHEVAGRHKNDGQKDHKGAR